MEPASLRWIHPPQSCQLDVSGKGKNSWEQNTPVYVASSLFSDSSLSEGNPVSACAIGPVLHLETLKRHLDKKIGIAVEEEEEEGKVHNCKCSYRTGNRTWMWWPGNVSCFCHL